jgi:alpha-ketoglutarate-dependent taurine dioxygenase
MHLHIVAIVKLALVLHVSQACLMLQIVPFDTMEAYYHAYNRFTALTKKEDFQYHTLLKEGDFLVYDNHRMLHARTAFSGARWLRGVYFDSF